MRRSLLALLAITVLAAVDDGRDVFLLLGQSNMDGRGKVADLTPEQAAPHPDILLFYHNPLQPATSWIPLAPGYSLAPGKGPKTLPSATFGPEVSFGPAIAAAMPALHVALIKASQGGTSLAKDWKPGEAGNPKSQGPCYVNFTSTLAEALGALPGPHRLRGVVWHQGESDAGLKEGAYRELLAAFIARVRADTGVADLPIVIGQVFDNGKRDVVRAEQEAAATTIPHAAFVTCEGTETWDHGTHFDARSQLELGRRYAAAMAKLLQ